MKKLRFDLYSGFADDGRYTEKDRWVQTSETVEELAQAVYDRIIENAEELLNDEDDDDTTDD